MPPAPKRRRSSSPQLTEVRDSRLYFNDGSVVLAAREPSKVVYFRVHASVLSRESTVFDDMFKIPSPAPSEQDTYDGVPLVVMHDKAHHLRGFLTAIYEPHKVFLPRFSDKAAEGFTGPLILAKKYEAKELRDRIIEHIECDWPGRDYYQWKFRVDDFYRGDWDWPDAENLLKLSWTAQMRNELKTPLAMAYYALCCDEDHLTHLLTSEDFAIIFHGRRKMEQFYRDSILSGTGNPVLSLCASCKIGSFKDNLLLDMVKSNKLDFLRSCEERTSNLSSGQVEGLCRNQQCKQKAVEWLTGLTLEVYSKLPEFYPIGDKDSDSS